MRNISVNLLFMIVFIIIFASCESLAGHLLYGNSNYYEQRRERNQYRQQISHQQSPQEYFREREQQKQTNLSRNGEVAVLNRIENDYSSLRKELETIKNWDTLSPTRRVQEYDKYFQVIDINSSIESSSTNELKQLYSTLAIGEYKKVKIPAIYYTGKSDSTSKEFSNEKEVEININMSKITERLEKYQISDQYVYIYCYAYYMDMTEMGGYGIISYYQTVLDNIYDPWSIEYKTIDLFDIKMSEDNSIAINGYDALELLRTTGKFRSDVIYGYRSDQEIIVYSLDKAVDISLIWKERVPVPERSDRKIRIWYQRTTNNMWTSNYLKIFYVIDKLEVL